MRRPAAALLAAVVLVLVPAACTDSSNPSPAQPTAPAPSPSVALSATEQRLADVYVTLLRTHFRRIDSRSGLVFLQTKPARGPRAFSQRLQDAITERAGPALDVRWTDDVDDVMKPVGLVRGGGYYVELPRVPARGDGFRLAVFALCGGLCGEGDRYVMTERADGWHARPVGPMTIA